MDSSTIVTHLTDSVLPRLFENPGKKMRGVVQVLDCKKQTLNNKTLHTVKLSDGYFFHNFILYPNIVEEFLDKVKVKDIVEAGIVKKDHNSLFMLVYEFQPIYARLDVVIGKPLEYKLGMQNKEGENVIPDSVIASRTIKRSAQMIEGILNENYGGEQRHYKIESDSETENKDNFTEIINLNHYDRSFKIRGRIVKKNELKRFKLKDGKKGSVFNIVIKDSTKAIQGTFFNDFAEKFYPLLEEGKIYSFSEADIKPANKYNTTDNKFELHFSEKSEIKKLTDDKDIGMFHFKFAQISEIEGKPENELVDVIAIIDDPGTMKEVHLKNGDPKEKRTIKIKDDSGYAIDVTLWGDWASTLELQKGSIIIFQDVRVKNYNGKTLTFIGNSKIVANIPDHPRHKELLAYMNSNKIATDSLKNLADAVPTPNIKFMKIKQMEKECNILNDDQENTKLYFTVIGHLTKIGSNLYYESCESDTCMKKVSKNSYGSYDCEKCHKTFERPRARFMASLKFSDDTGSIYTMASGEDLCQYIFKKSPEDIKSMKEGDEKTFSEFLKDVLFEEFRLRLIAKKDPYNNEGKIRYQLIKVIPIILSPETYLHTLQNILENQNN